ncbi:hypothetical protein Pelo_6637 [Pelomyxa schiedti]|nr:hypothetical protein Pelo_6637 [Pelomyxa schiedti]
MHAPWQPGLIFYLFHCGPKAITSYADFVLDSWENFSPQLDGTPPDHRARTNPNASHSRDSFRADKVQDTEKHALPLSS